MNAPRDPWDDFAAVFHDELMAQSQWTDEMREAARKAYELEQIATAQSEEAQAAMIRSYNHE